VKISILFLLILVALAATVAVYDSLESGANLIEILLLPFTTDQSAAGAMVVGGPILGIFIALCALEFVGVPLVVVTVASCLGGWVLRKSGSSISKRASVFCVVLAAACATAMVLFVIQNDLLPISRPAKPKTPATILACLAGANAAFSLFVATVMLRLITGKATGANEEDRLKQQALSRSDFT
jgi:hypothetical protein